MSCFVVSPCATSGGSLSHFSCKLELRTVGNLFDAKCVNWEEQCVYLFTEMVKDLNDGANTVKVSYVGARSSYSFCTIIRTCTYVCVTGIKNLDALPK